jgi:hypothetical protein
MFVNASCFPSQSTGSQRTANVTVYVINRNNYQIATEFVDGVLLRATVEPP